MTINFEEKGTGTCKKITMKINFDEMPISESEIKSEISAIEKEYSFQEGKDKKQLVITTVVAFLIIAIAIAASRLWFVPWNSQINEMGHKGAVFIEQFFVTFYAAIFIIYVGFRTTKAGIKTKDLGLKKQLLQYIDDDHTEKMIELVSNPELKQYHNNIVSMGRKYIVGEFEEMTKFTEETNKIYASKRLYTIKQD